MPIITFDKFDLGIDHRKGAAVADANRLIEMKNAHVTTGLATEKRPGLKKIATLEDGTKGLFAAFGKLNTFYCGSDITHSNDLFQANKLTLTDGDSAVTSIEFVDVFHGFFFVAAKHANGKTFQHYLNGGTSQITDANCQHTAACVKGASKIFAVGKNGDTVWYSKTGDPTVWKEANDAGFLPTGMNSRGSREAKALGIYQNNLVVLSRDNAQVYAIDPDPAAMSLIDVVDNVGTSYQQSLATVSGDLYFLSDYGFRSITTSQLIAKLSDVDIGAPIDDIARAALKQKGANVPVATYFYGTGKYMCAIGKQIFVYAVSRTAKIAAWSHYELPAVVDAWAELEGVLYLRCGNDVYCLDEDAYTDDGKMYEVTVQLPYLNFKSPKTLKRIKSITLWMEGECYFSAGVDARNRDSFTDEVRITNKKNTEAHIPVLISGYEFSFKFRNLTDKAFRLDAMSVDYDVLGVR